MDKIWERAIETALDDQTDYASARTLTLDGAVKCVQGGYHRRSFLRSSRTFSTFLFPLLGFRRWSSFRVEEDGEFEEDGDVTLDEKYGVIVVGGGHVGCGAALPSARVGKKLFFSC
ncbi:FAD/NAD(P)-binding domain containing protein [Parasponia andersonii]|uniref:FAD/NAD(P)-binding domain containing protein n=1 Tax=Parasponia andersonii TaxID=3476 RepID=A0A2P5CC25_PARAD|nr:FAD/NAD(P)-binding domain containing protein [Parasponia andersonii]